MRITWSIFLENLTGWCRAFAAEMAAIARLKKKRRETYLRKTINASFKKSRGSFKIDSTLENNSFELLERRLVKVREFTDLFFLINFVFHRKDSIIGTNNFTEIIAIYHGWINKILKFQKDERR